MTRWRIEFAGTQADGREHSTTVESRFLLVALWEIAIWVFEVHFIHRPFWRVR